MLAVAAQVGLATDVRPESCVFSLTGSQNMALRLAEALNVGESKRLNRSSKLISVIGTDRSWSNPSQPQRSRRDQFRHDLTLWWWPPGGGRSRPRRAGG